MSEDAKLALVIVFGVIYSAFMFWVAFHPEWGPQ